MNLASRLESLNKEHHTKLLMTGATESTAGKLSGNVAFGTSARARQGLADRLVHGDIAGGEGCGECVDVHTSVNAARRSACARNDAYSAPFSCFADTKEEPVGLVLTATGSKLLRADTETPLAARPGDLLFAGDGLRTETGPASFLFCPAKALDTLAAVRRSPPGREGSQGEDPARFPSSRRAPARLPQTLRVAAASQQHYGVSMTRGLNKPEVPPTPRDKLAADVQAELAPYETALAADPKDQGRAGHRSDHLRESQAASPTRWTVLQAARAMAGRGVDQEQDLRAGTSAGRSGRRRHCRGAAGGQTYALLVGISKYAKPELSLQFANADASVFGKLLESPRGGGVPSSNVLLLTDEKATTAAVRNGFQDFLKRRASKNDTVVILIAGHGTVEVPGSKNAFILTYDSDPQDLKSTALAMDELQSLFEEQLSKVGRVLLFVDVCKAGTIGHHPQHHRQRQRPAAGRCRRRSFRTAGQPPARSFARRARVWRRTWRLQLLRDQGTGRRGRREQGRRGGRRRADQVRQRSSADGDREQAASARVRHLRQHDAACRTPRSRASTIAHWRVILDSRNGGPLYLAGAPQGQVAGAPASQETTDRFTSAINAGRILPTDPNNAFTALRDLQASADARAISGAPEPAPGRTGKQGAGSFAAISGRRRDAAVAR